MNSFGLGLVLDFADNATSGMRNAVSVFNQMSIAADTLSDSSTSALIAAEQLGTGMIMLGDSVSNAGSSILSVFGNLASNVVSTGSDFESFRITLNALYGDAGRTEEQLNKLIDFAATSPFEVSDVKDLLVTLQSQGVDAFAEMTNSANDFTQSNLNWIGSLMAFKPDVPMQRWKLAIQNYLGSGETRILRNLLDMGNIDDIIGRSIGTTPEERMRDLADIASAAGIETLMTDLFGTWQQSLSNFEDQVTKLYLAIADSGAYDSLKEILGIFTSILSSMDDAELDNVAGIIADALNELLVPVKQLSYFVADLVSEFIDLAQAHPVIAKLVAMATALVGVMLLLSGTIIKVAGTILMFSVSIKYLGGLSNIVSMLSAGFTSLLFSILPLVAASYLFYLAWSRNIGGVADLITDKLGFAATSVSIIFDALFDNTLSEDRWIQARDMGILPFIEAILNLKYEVHQALISIQNTIIFVMEFISTRLPQMGSTIKDVFFGAISGIAGILGGIPDVIANLDWSNVGSALLLIFAGIMRPDIVLKIVAGIFTLFKKIFILRLNLFMAFLPAIFQPVVGLIVDAFAALLPALGTIFSSVPVLIATAIIAGIAVLIALITNNSDSIVAAFTAIWNKLPEPVQNVLRSIAGFISNAVNSFIDAMGLRPLLDQLSSTMPAIIAWFSGVGNQIIGIISQLISWVSSAWDSWLGDLVRNLLGFVSRVVTIVAGIASVVIPMVLNFISMFIDAFTPIIDQVGSIFNDVVTVINGALDVLIGFIEGVFTGNWERAWNGVYSIFEGIIGGLADTFKGVINTIITFANTFIKGLNTIKIPGTDIGVSIPEIPMLNTGGFVNQEGIAYLHPSEVVVNSPMTKQLGAFLDDYRESSDQGNKSFGMYDGGSSEEEDVVIEIPDGGDDPRNFPSPQPTPATPSSPVYDYSVTFSPGSIVIQTSGVSDSELEAAAEKLMKIIERKQQLKNMAVRKR